MIPVAVIPVTVIPMLRLGVVLLGLGLLAGCSEFGRDIDKVKATETTSQSNEELVKDLAGARGTIEWTAREPAKYGQGIVLVEARVEKTGRSGRKQLIQLQWLHNRENGAVAIEDLLVDGRSHGILGVALEMLKLELE